MAKRKEKRKEKREKKMARRERKQQNGRGYSKKKKKDQERGFSICKTVMSPVALGFHEDPPLSAQNIEHCSLT